MYVAPQDSTYENDRTEEKASEESHWHYILDKSAEDTLCDIYRSNFTAPIPEICEIHVGGESTDSRPSNNISN